MTIIIMMLAGCVAGFALDNLIARMAKEPYQRGDSDGDDAAGRPGATALDLHSEAGALAMPALLTDRWWLRRTMVVAATAALFALVGWRYAADSWQLPIVAAYVSALIICTSTDLLAYRVPNAVTYPAILGALIVGLTINDANRLDVVFGGLVFGGLLFVPSILTGGAMGMGDVKLAFFVGFALGLTLVVPAMLLMAISGGLAAALMLVTRVRSKGDPIPYAPFIAGAALVVLLLRGTAFHSL
ncbi:MAG TPA: A24 family peptidase [Dehalococcoidia bacterium]|nr:A24 family peptidase [Dehalococcoidia bacterium]